MSKHTSVYVHVLVLADGSNFSDTSYVLMDKFWMSFQKANSTTCGSGQHCCHFLLSGLYHCIYLEEKNSIINYIAFIWKEKKIL